MPGREKAHVITVSDRSAAGLRDDLSGPFAVRILQAAGYETTVSVVSDGAEPVAGAVRTAVASGARLVVTSGGTGVSPTDRTPEGTRMVIDRELPGLAEMVRSAGAATNPHAVLARGVAGVVDATVTHRGAFIVNFPGQPAAVGEGLEIVLPLVPHLLDQLEGGDH